MSLLALHIYVFYTLSIFSFKMVKCIFSTKNRLICPTDCAVEYSSGESLKQSLQ